MREKVCMQLGENQGKGGTYKEEVGWKLGRETRETRERKE